MQIKGLIGLCLRLRMLCFEVIKHGKEPVKVRRKKMLFVFLTFSLFSSVRLISSCFFLKIT